MSDKQARHEIDCVVGQRLRLFRSQRAFSQAKVADTIGVTFQQVQKYERGTNRVSAGMLWEFARMFDVPITAFFEGVNSDMEALALPELSARDSDFLKHYVGLDDVTKKLLRDLVERL